jgi:hypothetical protein
MINSLHFLIKLKSNLVETCRALNKDRIFEDKLQEIIKRKMKKNHFDLRTYKNVRFI